MTIDYYALVNIVLLLYMLIDNLSTRFYKVHYYLWVPCWVYSICWYFFIRRATKFDIWDI